MDKPHLAPDEIVNQFTTLEGKDGPKKLRKLLKAAHPDAKVLLVIAEPCDNCESPDGQSAYHASVMSNVPPIRFLRAVRESIQDADHAWAGIVEPEDERP